MKRHFLRRRAAAAFVVLVSLAPFGCTAVWGITGLDLEADGGATDRAPPPPQEDATTSADAGDAAPDRLVVALPDASDAHLDASAPPTDDAAAADFCVLHASDTNLILCEDFDSYGGDIAALNAGGTWGDSPYMQGVPETFDLTTQVMQGPDMMWALHTRNDPSDSGEDFTQLYLYDHTTSSPTRIEIQLDVWMSNLPSHNDNDHVSIVGVGFEHGGMGTPDNVGLTVDDTGIFLDTTALTPNTILKKMTWTHLDWTLVLNQVPSSPTLSMTLAVGEATATIDASDPNGYGGATIQLGVTYDTSPEPAHDIYWDNVLVTAQ